MTAAVDYRLLLLKYINHVGECEGSIFHPGRYHKDASSVHFTAEELAAFAELADLDKRSVPDIFKSHESR